MKKALLVFLVLALCQLGSASPTPGGKTEDAEKLPEKPGTVRDPEFIYGGNYPNYPFDLFRTFNDVFELMRQQMGFMLSHLPGRSELPENGNTTSVTKVIDGHKYTVNETVYSGGDGSVGTIFKVRILDIRPAENDTSAEKRVSPLPTHKDAEQDSLENDVNSLPIQKRVQRKLSLENDLHVNDLAAEQGWTPHPQSEWVEDRGSSLHAKEAEISPRPYELGNDLRVNELAEEQGWTPHPAAEWVLGAGKSTKETEWDSGERWNENEESHSEWVGEKVEELEEWKPHPNSELVGDIDDIHRSSKVSREWFTHPNRELEVNKGLNKTSERVIMEKDVEEEWKQWLDEQHQTIPNKPTANEELETYSTMKHEVKPKSNTWMPQQNQKLYTKVTVENWRPYTHGPWIPHPNAEFMDGFQDGGKKASTSNKQINGNSEWFYDLSDDSLVNEPSNKEWTPRPNAEPIHFVSIDQQKPKAPKKQIPPYDLSGDIRVNQIAAAQGWAPYTDSEWVVEKEDLQSPQTNQKFQKLHDLSHDIHVNELAAAGRRTPHPDSEWVLNLNDDLDVNELAAAQGWTPHPDSEWLDFENEIEVVPDMEKFRYDVATADDR